MEDNSGFANALTILSAVTMQKMWRPIAEAPRDGTPVLLWIGVGMSEPWAQTGRWSVEPSNGWSGWVDTYEGIDLAEPTHWIPLPPPPVSE